MNSRAAKNFIGQNFGNTIQTIIGHGQLSLRYKNKSFSWMINSDEYTKDNLYSDIKKVIGSVDISG